MVWFSHERERERGRGGREREHPDYETFDLQSVCVYTIYTVLLIITQGTRQFKTGFVELEQ